MTVEQRAREYCPCAGETVTIVRLYTVESGGGCQMDIGAADSYCERSLVCPCARICPDCLLNL